MSQRIPMSGI